MDIANANCMTVVVGKHASKTGFVMVAHNEDDYLHARIRHFFVPAKDWEEGALLPAEEGYTRIPQIRHTYAYWWCQVRGPEGGLSTSDSFANENGVVIVSDSSCGSREDEEEIKSIEDLKGKKTANSPNSTYASVAEKAGAEVTYVDTLGETMALLEEGRVNATLNDKDSAESYLSEHPEAKVKIVLTVAGEPVAVPMKKGAESDSLQAEIDRIFQEARENGKLAELSIKYFGVDLTKPL